MERKPTGGRGFPFSVISERSKDGQGVIKMRVIFSFL
jgi:hypothetical protein